jgi:enoyl-CoA hydratase/carnithine racemase
MSESSESIQLSTVGAVRIIQLTGKPKRANPLSTTLMRELLEVVRDLAHDDTVGAAVLCGTEQFFSVGSDISEMAGKTALEWLERNWMDDWDTLRQSPKPMVAAVRGMAMGGGLELALLCDLMICGEGARLALPETGIGVVPGAGGTQRLIALCGRAIATDMILTGRELSGLEAAQHGIAARVVPDADVLETATVMAQRISERGKLAVRFTRELLREASDGPIRQSLRLERLMAYMVFDSPEVHTHLNAFLERKKDS